jgi:hypothetical protein
LPLRKIINKLTVYTGSVENLQIPIKFTCPGKERQDSVFNGLQVSGSPTSNIAAYANSKPKKKMVRRKLMEIQNLFVSMILQDPWYPLKISKRLPTDRKLSLASCN